MILEQIKVNNTYPTLSAAKKDGWTTKKPNNPTEKYPDNTFRWSYISINNTFMYKENEQTSVTSDPQQPDPSTTTPSQTQEEILRNKLLVMFDSFEIYDQSGSELVKSVRNDETSKNYIVDTAIRKGSGKTDKELDDIFVQLLVRFLIKKKKFPLRIEFDGDYEINLFERAIKGLSKVLFEQNYAGVKTIWIKYKDDGKNFGFTDDKNGAVASLNVLPSQSQAVSGPDKDPIKPPVKKDVVNVPEKRPEEELGLQNNKLLDDIYKKASVEGIDSVKGLIDKNFSSRQKKIINSVYSEGYVVLRPINPNMYEEMDVKARYSEDFEPFKEFKMYRLKGDTTTIDELTVSLKNMDFNAKRTKKECKEIIEQYHKVGKLGKKSMSDEQRKNAASNVWWCRRTHKFDGKLDFSKISEKLDEIGSTSWVRDSGSSQFAINYSNRTVGTGDNVIQIIR